MNGYYGIDIYLDGDLRFLFTVVKYLEVLRTRINYNIFAEISQFFLVINNFSMI